MTFSRRWLVTVAVLATVAVVVALLVTVGWAPLAALDETAVQGANAVMAPREGLTAAVGLVTDLGMSSVVQVLTAVAVLGSLLARHYRAALYLAACRVVEYVVENGLKHVVGRERPVVPVELASAGGGSFPSGHTMGTAVLWISLAVLVVPLVARRRWVVGPVAVVVGAVAVSRVLLGVHFPSDVVGAMVLGALVPIALAPLAGVGWRRIVRPEPEDVDTGPLPVIRLGRRLPPRRPSSPGSALRLVGEQAPPGAGG